MPTRLNGLKMDEKLEETPGFLIFKCQNAHRPPQPQKGQET